MNRIRLSIVVPTYNRLHLLKSSVGAILRDIQGYDAELVVSDNCSDGCVFETLRDFSGTDNLRVFRNESNIGGNRNIGRLINEYARGEFIWILGDDDLIVDGATRRVLEVINKFPEINYILANHTYKEINERLGMEELRSSDFSSLGSLLFAEGQNGVLDKFEDAFMFSNVPAAMTSLICHIAKRDVWSTWDFQGSDADPFPTWEITFPHLVTVTPKLVGRPIYFHADPLAILFVGAQVWFNDHWNRILASHVLSYSDFLADLGVDDKIVSHYRSCVFSGASASIDYYLNSLPTRYEKISYLRKLSGRYWKESSFRVWLKGFATQRLKKLLHIKF